MSTRTALVCVILLGLAFVPRASAETSKPAGAAPAAGARDEEVYELQKLLVDTLDQVERNYVHPISRRKLVEAAIKGILSELDPYSSYIGPQDMDQFRTVVESEFGGIGIQVEIDRRDGLKVISPLVGSRPIAPA